MFGFYDRTRNVRYPAFGGPPHRHPPGRDDRQHSMRNLITGLVAFTWGGLILLCGFLRGGPQGEGAARAGSVCGLVTGGLIFVAGVFCLVVGLREVWPEMQRKKRRRRRRRDDDYDDENRPRQRRRPRRDDDD